MGILENISAGMENYTKSERRIAEFIINNVLAFTINPIRCIKDYFIAFCKKNGI